MNTHTWRCSTMALLIAGLGAMFGGCSSGVGSRAEADHGGGNRPLVAQSAVEAAMSDGGSDLAFFDDLESRPLASQDDAIHATLLLGTGSSAPTFEQRLAMAKQLGYVPASYNRPAHQAVTLGEVSQMIVKILEGQRPALEEQAIAKLVHRGIAPPGARANQGLTGAQLVSMAGGVRDAMALEGVRRVEAPTVPEPRPMPRPAPVAASTPSPVPEPVAPMAEPSTPQPVMAATDVPSTAPASSALQPTDPGSPVPPEPTITTRRVPLAEAEHENTVATPSSNPAPSGAAAEPKPTMPNAPAGSNTGRAEPLPNIPVGTPPPAIELQDPNSKPSVIGPDNRVISPDQPKKGEAPKIDPTAKSSAAKPEIRTDARDAKALASVPGKSSGDPHSDAQPDLKKEDLKKLSKNGWVAGQPIKKTANAEESK